MAVPRNYAAGLDYQLAKAQLASGNFRLLLAQIDRAERRVRYADGLEVDGLARIRHALVGRAFASVRGKCKARCSHEGGSDGAEQDFASRSVHPSLLSVSPRPRAAALIAMMRRDRLERKCRVALIAIAGRYSAHGTSQKRLRRAPRPFLVLCSTSHLRST